MDIGGIENLENLINFDAGRTAGVCFQGSEGRRESFPNDGVALVVMGRLAFDEAPELQTAAASGDEARKMGLQVGAFQNLRT